MHIILDIGLSHTKVGFAKDSVPKHIVQTPLNMILNIRNTISELKTNSFAQAFMNNKQLYREVEEFLATIFYHLLQTNPK